MGISQTLAVLAVLIGAVFCSDYRVTNTFTNLSHIVLNLEYTGSDDYYLKPTSTIYKNLNFTVACHSFSDLSFKITDFNGTRFQIPQHAPFSADPLARATFPIGLSSFIVNYTTNPFNFKIIRRTDNELLFDSSVGNIVFSSHYIQISTKVASRNVWGFGQRFSNRFRVQPGKYTVFNRDRGQVVDKQQGLQTYGHYPIYFLRDNSTNYHINYLRNSNAMDVIVNESADSTYSFTYKIIGGMIDFRLILGTNSAQETIERFHAFLGQSAVPPFWSLGFHQCRWGYKNVTYLEDVIKGYESNDIPLDTIWSDIDYMIDFEDFTIDESRFPLARMNAILQKYHYIPIIDAGIKVNNGTAYNEGVKRGVFIKDSAGNEYRGKVWPGTTTFVDFFHPNATSYWEDMLNILYAKLKFSGVWLDMNELANFCDGPCSTPGDQGGFDFSKDLPYVPGSDGIQSHTISLNATRYGNLSEADVHAYSGFLSMYATHEFLAGKNLRPFIISRSTAPGAGKYGFHWTGDNSAGFDFLRNSIAENFMFQFWGIQMVGADICGFGKNTTEQLCARWFQLGAFYPFARNHNDEDSRSQEPYALGSSVLKSSQVNLKLRYSLLKSYYRHFVIRRGLGTVFQPVFFHYHKDEKTFTDDVSQTQFMLGNELMFAPVTEKGALGRSVYFPGNFYDFHNGSFIAGNETKNITNLVVDPIPIFIREGHGVFVQNATAVTKTSQLDNHFEFRAGMQFVQNASTGSVKRHSAVGYLLGLKNYNDQNKISLCIYQGCQYQMFWTLQVYSNGTKSLDLQTYYEGGAHLNQPQYINAITLHTKFGTVSHKFASGIEISKTGRQTFVLNSAQQKSIEEQQ